MPNRLLPLVAMTHNKKLFLLLQNRTYFFFGSTTSKSCAVARSCFAPVADRNLESHDDFILMPPDETAPGAAGDSSSPQSITAGVAIGSVVGLTGYWLPMLNSPRKFRNEKPLPAGVTCESLIVNREESGSLAACHLRTEVASGERPPHPVPISFSILAVASGELHLYILPYAIRMG